MAIGDVEELYIAEARQEKRRGRWQQWAALAACLCLVASVLVPWLRDRGGTYHTVGEDVKIYVNQLPEWGTSPDMDVVVRGCEVGSQEWLEIQATLLAETGVSLEGLLARLPERFRENVAFHVVGAAVGGGDGGYADHDYVLTLRTDGGEEATVAISGIGAPLRDLFLLSETPRESTVYGVPMTVHGFGESFWVAFTHRGVYYDVETDYLALEELTELLSALVEGE